MCVDKLRAELRMTGRAFCSAVFVRQTEAPEWWIGDVSTSLKMGVKTIAEHTAAAGAI